MSKITERMQHPSDRPPYRRGYDPMLVYAKGDDGKDLSFEEVRALYMENRMKSKQTNIEQDKLALELERFEEAKRQFAREREEEQKRLAKEREELMKEKERMQVLQRSNQSDFSSNQQNRKRMREEEDRKKDTYAQKRCKTIDITEDIPISMSKSKGMATPTVTMHTKKAMDDLLPMFRDSDTTSMGKQPPTPTMTIHSKLMANEVISLFSEPLDFDDHMDRDTTAKFDRFESTDENVPPPNAQSKKNSSKSATRRPLGLEIPQQKLTNGDFLKSKAQPKSVPTNPTKRTNFDAIHDNSFDDFHENALWDEDPDTMPEVEHLRGTSKSSHPMRPPTLDFEIYEDTDLLPSGSQGENPTLVHLEESDSSIFIPDKGSFDDSQSLSQVGFDSQSQPSSIPSSMGFQIFDDFSEPNSDRTITQSIVTDLPLFDAESPSPSVTKKKRVSTRGRRTSTAPTRSSRRSSGIKSTPVKKKLTNGIKSDLSLALIDPFEENHKEIKLQQLKDSIKKYPGFFDSSSKSGPILPIFKPAPKTKGKRKSLSSSPFKAVGGTGGSIKLNNIEYDVHSKIGEGAFASIYKVENTGEWGDDESCFAIKVEQPPSNWEWYIANQLYSRIPVDTPRKDNFIKYHSYFRFKDKSIGLMDFNDNGSLQDLINLHLAKGQKMEESLVIFYTIEMLHLIGLMHKAGVVHNDVKPDNFLIKHKDCEMTWDNWTPDCYDKGWSTRGLILIDYGRSLDTSLYPSGSRFTGDCHVDEFKCLEMQKGRPWTYQPDLYGICSVVHCMLHGTYMETVLDKRTGKHKPREAFKRYWASDELWKPFFEEFINIEDCDSLPDLDEWRERFEQYLVANPAKTKSIRTALVKLGIMLYDSQKR